MVEASTSGLVEVRSTELFHLAGAHDTFKGMGGTSGDIFLGTGNDVAVAGKGKGPSMSAKATQHLDRPGRATIKVSLRASGSQLRLKRAYEAPPRSFRRYSSA
jgi:hypothetical protein